MIYTIRFKTSTKKTLHDVEERLRTRLESKIAALGTEPRPAGCKQLRAFGTEKFWRVRVGEWRVIYQIDDANKELVIHAVKHRREAYRR